MLGVLTTLLATAVAHLGHKAAFQAALPQRALDYNRDIRPILAENCFACHGFDEKARKADLRLDRAEFAYAQRDEIVAITPHSLAQSEVWRRINSTDPDEVMPSPESHRVLTTAQKAMIGKWIEEGAPYAEHWSFIAPVKAELPTLDGFSTAHAIDAFVRERLAREALQPAPRADASTLIRRVSFDLTGLPPSADDALAFARTTKPDAYEALVDALLASPHFGERLALPWLDAARYADTNGFSIDGGRHAWLWRDYVINAFNTNKPYDRFLCEQLAGDLLPDKNDETLIATGFERNSMVTHEGGTIDAENLVVYGADRVKTFGEAVLGLTLACAQCHDHKFDPISQKDYYSLFAYFNTSSEGGSGGDGGVNAAPTAHVKSVLQAGDEAQLRARITQLETALASPRAEAISAWEAQQRVQLAQRGRDFALHGVKLRKISTPNTGSGFSIEGEQFALVERPMGFVAFDVSMELPPLELPITGLRVVMHPSSDAPTAGWGWMDAPDGKKSFALTNISLSAGAVPSDQVNLSRMIELTSATANCWSGDNHPLGVLNTKSSEAWIPDSAHEGPVSITVTFARPLSSADAKFLTAQLNFGRHGNVTAKRMEFFAMTGCDDGSVLPSSMIDAIQTDLAQRSPELTAQISAYFAAHSNQLAATRTDLANARELLAARTESFAALVMDTAAAPRETFILNRGNYADPRERVVVTTPAVLPPLPEGAPANRLGLAQWVTMPSNPLTARVFVNRCWQMLFGTGLVKTAADFGAQGEWPTHPELLDWLAVDFMEHGWDVKRLVKLIVMSQTYQQSSIARSEALERDPDNRLLARGPRFRLPAELIRDNALAASGLLVDALGGPSVNPYTPGDLWREISHYGSSPATAQTFHQDHGDKLYRRSLYTYWKRTQPPPNMVSFDAPNREVCTVDRANTNTPLQALVLLNDVQFVEAARGFAQRILGAGDADASRMRWAFAQACAREPSEQEMRVLIKAVARERATFAAHIDSAHALLATGESPRDESLDAIEHAAWTQVAALLLNLSETVTRN